jgi:alkanesulfonate monooxygenase SsuD/methylene tetrahydromethanopterin reductase-like flavin-dependent oxidoreductase (luciferase family)
MRIGVILPMAEVDVPSGDPTWAGTRSFAREAERGGLDSVWVFDHFFNDPGDGPVEAMHEGWTVLVATAAVTGRVQVGSIVLCAGFRHPGLLAKMAATADEVSDGRLILGIGSGWHDAEYDAFGFAKDHRVDRLEETLRVIRPLLAGDRVTFDGRSVTLRDAVLAPPPRHRVPILVAGEGPRMLALTATHADAWNTAWYGEVDDELRGRFAAFDEALARAGRDASSVERTVGVRIAGPEGEPDDDDEAFVGSVDEVARVLDGYEAIGADHLIVGLDPIVPSSLEHLLAAIALRG